MKREITKITSYSNIDNLIPGVRGQRAFPTKTFRDSDPFLMLDHIGPQQVGKSYFLDGKNGAHPHRGFETITFMFEGRMNHRDSLGNQSVLSSGSVQRMNAGSGIIHGGSMASHVETGRFHEMQLWVNNPKIEKMSSPDIHNVDEGEIPVIETKNGRLKIISGKLNGAQGPITTKAKTQIGHFISNGEDHITISGVRAGNRLMVYILEGHAYINDQLQEPFSLINFSNQGDEITIRTDNAAQVLILSGEPLNEPVSFGGPFVMNTQAEIEQAYDDFKNGLFGEITE